MIANFIPEESTKTIEARAVWNQEEDSWAIQKLELSGNRLRVLRPTSNSKLRRPESEYARQRYNHLTVLSYLYK